MSPNSRSALAICNRIHTKGLASMRNPLFSLRVPVFSALLAVAAQCVSAQSMTYPTPRKTDQVDDYHGTKVADPYRWLEDDNSAETAKWVEAENKVTFAYLDKIPYRAQVKARLEQLFNFPKYTPPFRKGDYLFF